MNIQNKRINLLNGNIYIIVLLKLGMWGHSHATFSSGVDQISRHLCHKNGKKVSLKNYLAHKWEFFLKLYKI